MYKMIAAGIAAVVLAGAAHAATETYDFTGYHPGNTYENSFNFDSNSGDTSVTVTMGTYYGLDYISDGSDGGGSVGQWQTWGLGVNTPGDNEHYVDGGGGNEPHEYLKFSFADNVYIEEITFLDKYYGNGGFEITPMGGTDYTGETYSLGTGTTGTWKDPYIGTWTNDGTVSEYASMFKIGAYSEQGFKIRSITVSYKMNEVPLPAAGFLLLGGLGGLAAMKRRKKA